MKNLTLKEWSVCANQRVCFKNVLPFQTKTPLNDGVSHSIHLLRVSLLAVLDFEYTFQGLPTSNRFLGSAKYQWIESYVLNKERVGGLQRSPLSLI
jgi:hypothetical protein